LFGSFYAGYTVCITWLRLFRHELNKNCDQSLNKLLHSHSEKGTVAIAADIHVCKYDHSVKRYILFMRKMEESNCALRFSLMHRRSVLLVHNSFVYYSWHFLFIWFRLVLWSWFLCLCYASLSYIMTTVFANYWHLLLWFVGYTSQQTWVESYHDMLTLKRVLLIWIVNQRNIYCVCQTCNNIKKHTCIVYALLYV
jgi:hypothetical protein